jgi:hypothetical protein
MTAEPLHAADHVIEQFLLAAELLRALGVVPDAGVFELAAYFGEPLRFRVDVKETSAARPCAR